MDKLYYTVEDVCYIQMRKGHLNRVGVGFNYQTGYGTTFNVGTDLFFNGKFGNNIKFKF